MATGLETAIARTAGEIIRLLGGHVGKEAKLRKARDSARPVMARRVADGLLDQLSATEAEELAGYLVSPDFEQVALQFAVARLHERDKQRDELLSAARDQIRQGLRLSTTLSAERRFGITDVVYNALLAAPHTPGNPAQAARLGHLVAMAARNGELLGRLPDLHSCRTEAQRLRAQVVALHSELRMPHTGVSRSVAWDRLYVEARPRDMNHKAFPVREWAQSGRRLVVLGDPGAGKSTMATKLAYDLASDPTSTEVPFLVVLRHLTAAVQTGERTLAEYLVTVARDPYNVTISPETVDYLLLNGRAVVVLDGLDELTDVSLRRRLADLIRGFATLYPMVPIVVTSRRVGYREAALDAALFPVLELMPFSFPQVEEYARHWFELDDGTAPAERERLAQSFLRDSSSIEDLRSNPLLLALLCAMYATDHYIPRLRAQIYERCALMVFERWDSMRGIKRPIEFEGRVRGAVQHLAWQLLTSDEAEMPRHRILRLLVDHLVGRGLDEDDAQAAAKEFLEVCAGRAWVLAEVGSTDMEPLYGFAHRTFLEFFAAEHLVRTRKKELAVWAELSPRVRASQWDVVGQLALQLIERNTEDGAELIVRAAMDEAARSPVRERQRLAHFGAVALQHVTLPPAAIERVVDEALGCFFSVPAEHRFRVLVDDQHFVDMTDSDTPLGVAMRRGLPSNLAYVQHAVAAGVSARIVAGDDRAHLLLENMTNGLLAPGRRAGWPAINRSVERAVVPLHDQWRARWRPRGTRKSSLLEIAGNHLENLYLVQTAMGAGFSWIERVVQEVNKPGDGVVDTAFCDLLLRRDTPWFSGARWQMEYNELGAAGRPSLQPWRTEIRYRQDNRMWRSVFLLVTLPYLELVRDADDRSGLLMPSDLSAAVAWPSIGPTPLRALLRNHGIAENVIDYLMRWSAGEFRVLGP